MDRKKEIIDTATSLFKQKGYTAVTMREIAKEIGLTAASLYNHIRSKQEILTILAMSVAERFTLGLKSINIDEVDTISKLEQIVILYIDITLENVERMEVLENNWIYLEGENLEYYKKLRQAFENNLRDILKEGVVSGLLNETNLEIQLSFLLYTLRSINKWYPYKQGISEELLKKDLLYLLMKGMTTKNSESSLSS